MNTTKQQRTHQRAVALYYRKSTARGRERMRDSRMAGSGHQRQCGTEAEVGPSAHCGVHCRDHAADAMEIPG